MVRKLKLFSVFFPSFLHSIPSFLSFPLSFPLFGFYFVLSFRVRHRPFVLFMFLVFECRRPLRPHRDLSSSDPSFSFILSFPLFLSSVSSFSPFSVFFVSLQREWHQPFLLLLFLVLESRYPLRSDRDLSSSEPAFLSFFLFTSSLSSASFLSLFLFPCLSSSLRVRHQPFLLLLFLVLERRRPVCSHRDLSSSDSCTHTTTHGV